VAERTDLTTGTRERAEYDRSSDEIRRDIAAKRESISATVDRLNTTVQRVFDWKTYVVDHPVAALGIAAGVGFLASRILVPGKAPTDRLVDAAMDTLDDLSDRVLDRFNLKPRYGRAVRAALMAMATRSAGNYVRKQLRGSAEREAGADLERPVPQGDQPTFH
jgi:ElaB/YqjD/DUF883 family membrane-anchored ribosome-binding protein